MKQYHIHIFMAVVIAMAFAVFLLSGNYLASGREGASVINLVGQQRLNSQRVVSLMLSIEVKTQKGIPVADDVDNLKNQLATFEFTQAALLNGNDSLNLKKKYNEKLKEVLEKSSAPFASFVKDVKMYIQATPARRSGLLETVMVSQREYLENQMNVTKEVEEIAGYQLARFSKVLWGLSVLFVLIVISEIVFFIVRPTSRRLSESEEQLKMISEKYSNLYNKTPAMMHSINHKGKIISVSDFWAEKMGYTKEEVIGKKSTDFMPDWSREKAEDILPEYFKTGKCKNVLYQMIRKNGEVMDVLLSAISEKDSAGNVIRSLVVLIDITQEKKIERKLLTREEQFRTLANNAGNITAAINADYRIEYVNNHKGYPITIRLNDSVFDFVAENTNAEKLMQKKVKEAFQTGITQDFKLSLNTTNANPCFLAVSLKPIKEQQKVDSLILIIRDVTELTLVTMQAEEDNKELTREVNSKTHELEIYQNELNNSIITINQAALVSIMDIEGVILYANDVFCTVSGYSLPELVGMKSEKLQADQINKDIYKDLWNTIRRGEVWKGELANKAKNGDIYWVNITVVPYLNVIGEIEKYICVRFDITKEKKLQKKLKQALKKEKELGKLKSRFVSTVSHQFRTPLAIIQSNSELLGMLNEANIPGSKGKTEVSINRITKEIRRMTELMDDVLLLGKVASDSVTPELSYVNIVNVLHEVSGELGQIEKKERGLYVEVIGKPRDLYLDVKMMRHALSNLISNALKYSEDDILIIACFENERVCLVVEDKGIGIPLDEQEDLFQPFYRAENAQNLPGTGLGLSIVKEYVEKNFGSIRLESKENEGSRFIIELPYFSEN